MGEKNEDDVGGSACIVAWLIGGALFGAAAALVGSILAPLFAMWMLWLTFANACRLGRYHRFAIVQSAAGAVTLFAAICSIGMCVKGYWLDPQFPKLVVVAAAGAAVGAIGFASRAACRRRQKMSAGRQASSTASRRQYGVRALVCLMLIGGFLSWNVTRVMLLRDLAWAPTAPILAKELQATTPIVRTFASQGLVKIGAPAVQHVMPAILHERGEVRIAAAQILGRIGRDAVPAAPALIQAAQIDNIASNPSDVGGLTPRAEAVNALWRLGPLPVDMLPILRVTLTSEDAALREWAADAIRHSR